MKNQTRKTSVRVHNLELPPAVQIPENIDTDIRFAARAALDQEKFFGSYQVSVVLTSEQEITKMNQRYLDKDRATDILCFPYAAGKTIQADIFISVDAAMEHAPDYRHTFREEILFLVIHGILHLLGWNDETENKRNKMWGRQEMILRSLNPVTPQPGSGPADSGTPQ